MTVAQLVEHRVVVPGVAGSIPVSHLKYHIKHLIQIKVAYVTPYRI